MISLHWELSVLSRAIAYPNLSGAAAHVGLSQPQLSRIVSRIERELRVTILDRSARRKSGWSPAAFKLAEVYSNSERKLEGEIHKLVKSAEPAQIQMGTLEGLSAAATRFSRFLLASTSVSVARLDVHDLNVLEELFLSGEMDLVLTSREPARRKFKFSRELGYQTLEKVVGAKTGHDALAVSVFSAFEFGTRLVAADPDVAGKCFVSNSLELRKTWIRQFGGSGIIPSELRRERGPEGGEAVFLIGADRLSPALWKQLEQVELR